MVKYQSTLYIIERKKIMTKEIVYQTSGTCSRQILVSVVDDVITEMSFVGGCNGNTKGIASLVKGMKVDDVIARLKGTDCRGRGTSCPDQLAKALEQAKSEN